MALRLRWYGWPLTILVWGALLAGFALHAHRFPWAHTVYTVYAPAARYWWAGEDIYTHGVDYFRYSPLVAIGFTPLAALPDEWGCPLWKVLNALLYAAAIITWARRVLPARLTGDDLALLLLLVLPMSLHSIYIGQANLLMISAMLLGLADATRGCWNRAAGWLALATLIKGYPVALGLLLVVLYPRKLALRFFGAIAVGLVLPFATLAPGVVLGQYASWLQHLQDSTVIMRERLRSIDHLLGVYGYPITPAFFARISVAAGVVVLVLALVAAARAGKRRDLLTRVFLLFTAWVLLFGPATESCTYAVAAPAIGWSLIDAFRRPSSRFVRGMLVASLLLMGPLVTDLVGSTVHGLAATHGSQPLGALLFAGHTIMMSWAAARPESKPRVAEPSALAAAA
jgi:hypothetical protein